MANVGSAEGTVKIDASGATAGAVEANKAFDSVSEGAQGTEKKVTKAGKDQATNYDTASKKVKQSSEYTGKAWVDTASKATVLAQSGYILYDSYDGVQSAQTASERATLKLSKANEAAQKAQDDYNDAVAKYGQDSPEAEQAALDLAQANDMASIAAQNADMAAGNLDDAWVQFTVGGASSALGLISGGAGLMESLKGLGGESGILGKVSEKVVGLSSKFGEFATGGVTKLVGGLSGIGSAFSSLGSLLAANPIIIILMAIALVAVLIITNWDAVRPFFEGLWNALKGIFEAAWAVIDAIVIKPLMAAWGLISQAAQIMYNVLVIVWNAIVAALTAAWNFINTYIVKPIMAGWNLISSAADTMKGILIGIWNGIYSTILGIWNWIDQNIITPIKTAWDTIGKAAGDMKKVLEDVWNGIKSMIDTVVKEIMKIIGPFIDAAKWVIDNVGGILDTVGGAVGDVVGGIGDFFGLSEGGVVRATPGGVHALLGEGGEDEYVVPASKVTSFISAMVGEHGGTPTAALGTTALSTMTSTSSVRNGPVTFNINGAQDPKSIMREIYAQGKSMRLWQ